MNDEDLPASRQATEGDRALDARREVLKRMGIYTAVSAPMLLGALKAERAVAATGGGIPGGAGTGAGGSTIIP